MARPRKPWYRSDRDWWMVEFHGRQHKLCRGRDNRDEVERQFHALMVECLANPPVDGGNPTVASIIEAFLESDIRRTGERFFKLRKYYLQRFADNHGNRHVGRM